MSKSDSAAHESAATTRQIESGRLAKALTQPMTIELVAPRQYDVTHDGTTRTVDVETGSCSCADYEYRGDRFVCKHVLAAAIHAVFAEGVRTRLQARVVAATREAGCPHAHGSITDDHDCEGPLGRGAFPCPQCVDLSPGEWSAWVTLVGDGPDASATVDRGAGVATDGGRELTGDHPLDGRCGECGARYTVDETVTNECPECGYSAFEPVATDGGTAVETTRPAETADRGCERCDDTSLADLKAARNPDGSIDHVCPECYRDGRGRAATRGGFGSD